MVLKRTAVALAVGAAAMLGGVVVLSDAAPPRSPQAALRVCDFNADPASLGSQLDAAGAGETICLGSGDYGSFAGAALPGRVTLRAAAGAKPRMAVVFKDATELTLDGLVIDGALLTGSTRDITIRNSRFTSHTTIDGLQNANVLLERNTHLSIDSSATSSPARIHLGYSGDTPSGVTVRDSLLAGGDSDGVQSGIGVNIIGNEFRDIVQKGPNHTDAIQLIGARGSVVRGNYIHDSSAGIVAYDGIASALIEQNVIDLPGRPWGIELYADQGSTVRHNTLGSGGCEAGECGLIDINRKPDAAPGGGTVVVDNVATAISVANGAALAERRGNLVQTDAASGDILGLPDLVGGVRPSSYDGFRLREGSPGAGAAADGRDAGIAR